VIEGTIESQSLNEGWEEYSFEDGRILKKMVKRHTIFAYYEGMDEIFNALKMLK
jgi:hypothetical protein